MEQLVEEGKVRAIGVSNFDVSLLRKCEGVRHVDSLQPPFSLIRREVAAAEIPWCNANRTGVIVYSPMQAGILTDSFSADRVKQMAPEDWRRKSSNFQTPWLEKNLALRDSLRPIAKRHETTVAAVALAWTLSWPAVPTTAKYGVSTQSASTPATASSTTLGIAAPYFTYSGP